MKIHIFSFSFILDRYIGLILDPIQPHSLSSGWNAGWLLWWIAEPRIPHQSCLKRIPPPLWWPPDLFRDIWIPTSILWILASRPWDILLRPSSIKGPPWYSEGSHPHDSWRYPYIWIYGYIYILYIYIYYYIRGSFSLGRWALVVPSMCLALPYICRCRLRFLDRGCSCSFPGHWAGNDADAMNKL